MSGLKNNYRIYQVAVTTAVTQLVSPTGNAKNTSGPTTPPVVYDDRGCEQGMNVRNIGANTVWLLSSPTDTVGAGYPLLASENAQIDVRDGRQLYVATLSGTSTLAVWEV